MGRFAVRAARAEDLEDILVVQKRAFGRVARGLSIRPEDLPPLQETLANLEQLHAYGVRFFVACDAAGHVIGSVRAYQQDDTVEIGRLVVEDGWERQGVATRLMDLLESSFPDAKRFELFTGIDASGTRALYAARGYEEFRFERLSGVGLVWLEKPGPAALP